MRISSNTARELPLANELREHNDELCSHWNTLPSAECAALLTSVVFAAHKALFTLAGQDEVV
jgi:hypothetical protein